MRAIANCTISFGLVTVPVKLYGAAEAKEFSFNLLHHKCQSRVKYHQRCETCNVEVTREDMIKGYELAKDQYVTFTADELKAVEAESTQSIEITEFVPLSKVDPIYFEKPYYLGADKGGGKAYRLLVEVMTRSGRVAVAKYAARGKEHLMLLRAVAGKIVAHQLLFASSIRDIKEVPELPATVSDKELEMASLLVDQLSVSEFKPEQYKDEATERLRILVERKSMGESVTVLPVPKRGVLIDLLDALKSSLKRA